MSYKIKSDKYKKARGGTSKILKISCSKCKCVLFNYQKDGPDSLKRMYIDRIYENENYSNLEKGANLVCKNCNELIATRFVYKKENRLALQLNVGAVAKSIVK